MRFEENKFTPLKQGKFPTIKLSFSSAGKSLPCAKNMAQPVPLTPPAAPARAGKSPNRFWWVSTVLTAAIFLLALAHEVTAGRMRLPLAGWLLPLLLLAATLSTLSALSRQLPLQNVLLAAFVTALIGSGAHLVSALSGIPLGPLMFGPEAGWKLFGRLPWILPLLWIVAVLNSRGVARLVLRPWRKIRAYGFWLMGLTALFTLIFDSALEPFATRLKHYWIWTPGGFSLNPQVGPVSNSAGWFLVTLLILAFVTPALINKQLSKRSGPDFHPLAVWLGAVFLFGVTAAAHGCWQAAAWDGVFCALIATFALRGAKW